MNKSDKTHDVLVRRIPDDIIKKIKADMKKEFRNSMSLQINYILEQYYRDKSK